MKKVLLIVIIMLVAPLCLQANVPLAVQINGPKKLATGSSKVPYTCDVQGNFNGTILSYCWSCTGEGGEDYSDLFDGGTNTYKIFITDAPTNFWLDVQVRYRSNTNSNEYILATEAKIRVMKPSFNIVREAGLNGGTPDHNTLIHMYFNTDDDDRSSTSTTFGEDYLQNSYLNNKADDEMLSFRVSVVEPGLVVKYGKLEVSLGNGLRIWKNNKKTFDSLLFEKSMTTIADGATSNGRNIIDYFMSYEVFVEAVERNLSAVYIKYNDEDVALLRYQAHAPIYGRLPYKSERNLIESHFTSINGCDWKVVLEENFTYNCIAYAVNPSVVSGVKFWVISHFDSSEPWQILAHNYLLGKPVGTYYYYGGRNYTSMDIHGNTNMTFQTSDVIKFFQKRGYSSALYSPLIYYYGNYHAARRASSSQTDGFYDPYDIFISKCGRGIGIIHRADDITSYYGSIDLMFR